MKKSPLKEFIISSVAAAVAGYLVKKGYEYFQNTDFEKTPEKNSAKERSLSDTSKSLVSDLAEKADSIKDNPAQQGLVATLAYTLVAFSVAKLLRKIV